MPKIVITPWKDHSQLMEVRSQFYPPSSYKGPDLRHKACNLVGVWKIRGHLPHTVEATALLIDAVLHDDCDKNSIFSIRATYSAAFCRFVTGLVDSKLGSQRKSMFQKAQELGVPASFVDLRHQATHGEVPSLKVLRQATERSLDWLWQYYWEKIEDEAGVVLADPKNELHEYLTNLKQQFLDILRQFLKEQIQAAKKPRKRSKQAEEPSPPSCVQLVRICKGQDPVIEVLSSILLEQGLLVPASKTIGSSMQGAFDNWDSLLKALSRHQRNFLAKLTDEMSVVLARRSNLDITVDPHREACFMWLDHIFTSRDWAGTRRRHVTASRVLSTCVMNPNHWTNRLATLLAVVRGDADTKKQWGRIVSGTSDKEKVEEKLHAESKKTSDASGQGQDDGAEDDEARFKHDLAKWGWARAPKSWEPKSIGMV